MIYSDDYQFVFYPMPKTATCSLWEVLSLQYGAKEYPQCAMRGRHVMRLPKDQNFDDYLFFTVVRHPFTRARSLWNHCQRLENITVDFEDFVWHYLVPRTTWLCQTQSEWLRGLRVDCVLKMERINEDFSALPFVCDCDVPVVNQGKVSKDFTERTYAGIQKWAEEDLEKFHYHLVKVL